MANISITGTFSINRKALEDLLTHAGHKIISLSKKSDFLLVGEKTASDNKIKKAGKFGITILRETEVDKILASLPKKYVYCGDRWNERKNNPDVIEVGVDDVIEAQDEYSSRVADDGEYCTGEMERAMRMIVERSKNFEKELMIDIFVEINLDEKQEFLKAFYRLVFLDLFCRKASLGCSGFSDYDLETWIKEKIDVKSILSDKFYKNFFNLLKFDDEEVEAELKSLQSVRDFISKCEKEEAKIK